MAFNCSEFPGLVFNSFGEFRKLRRIQEELRKKLSEPVTTIVNKDKKNNLTSN